MIAEPGGAGVLPPAEDTSSAFSGTTPSAVQLSHQVPVRGRAAGTSWTTTRSPGRSRTTWSAASAPGGVPHSRRSTPWPTGTGRAAGRAGAGRAGAGKGGAGRGAPIRGRALLGRAVVAAGRAGTGGRRIHRDQPAGRPPVHRIACIRRTVRLAARPAPIRGNMMRAWAWAWAGPGLRPAGGPPAPTGQVGPGGPVALGRECAEAKAAAHFGCMPQRAEVDTR